MGELLLREPSSGYSSNCDEAIIIRDPKSFSQHVLGIFAQFGENIASDWLKAESSLVDEEEIKTKMDDGVDTSLASKRIVLFVSPREAQPCLWDLE